MFKVGIGQAEGTDTIQTARKAIELAIGGFRGFQPQAGIVLADIDFNLSVLVSDAQLPAIFLQPLVSARIPSI